MSPDIPFEPAGRRCSDSAAHRSERRFDGNRARRAHPPGKPAWPAGAGHRICSGQSRERRGYPFRGDIAVSDGAISRRGPGRPVARCGFFPRLSSGGQAAILRRYRSERRRDITPWPQLAMARRSSAPTRTAEASGAQTGSIPACLGRLPASAAIGGNPTASSHRITRGGTFRNFGTALDASVLPLFLLQVFSDLLVHLCVVEA